MTCTWFELLSRIPLAGLRLSLCRRHVEHCPRCFQASETGETPPRLITAVHLPSGLDLWPGVKEGIEALRRPAAIPEVVSPQTRRSWRWAYSAAMATLLLTAGLWIIVKGRPSGPQPQPPPIRPAPQTRLCSAKVGDRPARVFLVKSRNPDRTIFWIAKDNSRS
jgi:hypothetical protein